MTAHNLNGLRVLNTRPNPQGQSLNDAIIAAGGQAIHYPALSIIPTAKTWLDRLPAICHHAIFVSANAVTYGLADWLNQDSWSHQIPITAIGKATAHALEQQGLIVDNMPQIADSDHLLALNALQDVKDKTILLFKGIGGRTVITDTLKQRGAQLIELDVYQRVMPEPNQQHYLSKDAIDIVLFTSEHAIHNMLTLLNPDAKVWLKATPCLVISSRLALAAAQLGLERTIVCDVESIMDTLHQFNKGLIHD